MQSPDPGAASPVRTRAASRACDRRRTRGASVGSPGRDAEDRPAPTAAASTPPRPAADVLADCSSSCSAPNAHAGSTGDAGDAFPLDLLDLVELAAIFAFLPPADGCRLLKTTRRLARLDNRSKAWLVRQCLPTPPPQHLRGPAPWLPPQPFVMDSMRLLARLVDMCPRDMFFAPDPRPRQGILASVAGFLEVFRHLLGPEQNADGHGILLLDLLMSPYAYRRLDPSPGASEVCMAELVLDAYPEAARFVTEIGVSALHICCRRSSPVRTTLVERLIELHPEAAQQRSAGGWLPMHIALVANASLPVLDRVIKAHPPAVHQTFPDNIPPIFFALEMMQNDEAAGRLLDEDPELAQVRNAGGALPLHTALCNTVDVAFLLRLLKLYPQATTVATGEGLLPLHAALAAGQGQEILEALLKANPAAVRVRDAGGTLPLHLAAEKGASEAICHRLLDMYPEAVDVQDDDQDYPLHCAMRDSSRPVGFALRLVTPKAAAARGLGDWLALHIALNENVATEVVHALLDACPASVREKTPHDVYPLHFACLRGAQPDLVLRILDMFPAALRIDSGGVLPLHLALHSQDPHAHNLDSVCLRFLEVWPASAAISSQGYHPLHLALEAKTRDTELILKIIELAPETAKLRAEKNGWLPLHYAVRSHLFDPRVVLRLLDLYPQATRLRTEDEHRTLPLTLALLGRTSEDICQRLLEANPAAVQTPCSSGFLPLVIAMLGQRSPDFVMALLDAYPAAAARLIQDNKEYPLHLAIEAEYPSRVVSAILAAHPAAAQHANKAGHLPYDLLEGSDRFYPSNLRAKLRVAKEDSRRSGAGGAKRRGRGRRRGRRRDPDGDQPAIPLAELAEMAGLVDVAGGDGEEAEGEGEGEGE